MILKKHELIQIADNEKLVMRDGMTQLERCTFYYDLSKILTAKGLYLVVVNRTGEDTYLYTIGNLEDIAIC